MSHTPGPWETGCLKTRVEVLPKGWNAPMCIADCHTHYAPDSERERVANARLIAAAPDLLEALEYAIAGMELAQTFLEDKTGGMDCYLAKARAAIAKAEAHHA